MTRNYTDKEFRQLNETPAYVIEREAEKAEQTTTESKEMKAPSITKGNFSVVAGSRTAHCCFGFSVVDFEGESIAEVLSTESDAKLFAAAPKLAEALNSALDPYTTFPCALAGTYCRYCMSAKHEPHKPSCFHLKKEAALLSAGYTEE